MVVKVKYPSTHYSHLTPGRDPNDKVIDSAKYFNGKEVVISEKLDGESCNFYSDGSSHARSLDSMHHWTRDWVKKFWAERFWILPAGWRVCGENLWATHSIYYDNLESYFYGYSIWDENNICLDWDATLSWFEKLDIVPVPGLYRGPYSDEIVKTTWDKLDTNKQEGLVIRLVSSYNYDQFSTSLAKLVRGNHVIEYVDKDGQPKHWKYAQITSNKLKDNNESNSIG